MSARRGGRAAGVSIGRFLRFDPTSLANADFVAVVAAIDRVHGVGAGLPAIPMLNWSSEIGVRQPNADAWLSLEFGPAGDIVPLSIVARIGVAYRRIKTLHEIGHYIDVCALPGLGFSSLHARELEPWRLSVFESRLFDELAASEAAQSGRRRELLADARRIDELWARSYAQ